MGIGVDGVTKLVQNGIAAQAEERQNARQLALLYVEFGFRAAEGGANLEATLAAARKIIERR